jgi:Galactose oxidase, central domain
MAFMGRRRGCAVTGLGALACACLSASLLAACGDSDTRVVRIERVTPDADPDCGAPDDARTLVVTALGEFPATEATARSVDVAGGAEVAIDGFPVETNSLEVEVRGFGGAVRAVGRTPLFTLEELEDGDAIEVFMAPLNGFCPTGPPRRPRDAPLAARAGSDRVLLAGGFAAGGEPVHEVELYDPSTGQFSGLGQPLYGSDLATGLAGASMTAMPDGRVVVAGGGATAFQVYDPAAGESGEFGPPQFLREARAHHAAVALDPDRLLLAGGCAQLDGAACSAGTGLSTSVILTVSTGELADGPGLARIRLAGGALREADGRVLLVGGVDETGAPVGEAERIDPDRGRAGELVADTGSAPALLAGGGALTGFAPPGAPASQIAAVVPPGATRATPVDSIEPRAGPALAPLESGQVLVLGGTAADGAAALYSPASGALEPLPAGPGSGERSGHAAIPLGDGSVLIVGGSDADGAPLDDAWIFRPELTGPWSGGRSATFATPESAAAMVPRDPGMARAVAAEGAVPAHYRIEASGGDDLPSEWAILGGPRFTSSLTLEASIAAEQGGAAVLLWFRDEVTTAVLALVPGRSARLFALEGGAERPLGSCTGQPIDAADLAPPEGAAHQLAVEATGGRLTAVLDGRTVLRCEVDPPAPGLVGVAPLGEGAVLRLDLISASR